MRDQYHRPAAHLSRHRPSLGAFLGELPGHSFKDAFGDGEFVPLSPHRFQLLGQLFFEFVQFRAARGDPFQQFGVQHAQNRRKRPPRSEQEPDGQLPASAAGLLLRNSFAASTASLLSSSTETSQLSSHSSRLK